MRDERELIALQVRDASRGEIAAKQDADYVFYELTRSICPECRRPIDAQIILRQDKVYMRKRCPQHGRFETLVYADAQAYTSQAKFNRPDTIPLAYTSQIEDGSPHDCGLCPDHQQHACLASSRSTAPAICSARCVSRTPVLGSA